MGASRSTGRRRRLEVLRRPRCCGDACSALPQMEGPPHGPAFEPATNAAESEWAARPGTHPRCRHIPVAPLGRNRGLRFPLGVFDLVLGCASRCSCLVVSGLSIFRADVDSPRIDVLGSRLDSLHCHLLLRPTIPHLACVGHLQRSLCLQGVPQRPFTCRRLVPHRRQSASGERPG